MIRQRGSSRSPGGPEERMPAELAARIGLAKDALPKLKEAEEAIKAGKMTGPMDWASGWAGRASRA